MRYCSFCSNQIEGSQTKKYCNDKCRQKWNYYNKPRSVNTYFSQRKRGYEKKLKAILLKGGKCEICSESRIATLCFHHEKPETKSFGLDVRSFSNLKWSSVMQELNKCKLLCHNCHSIIHNGGYWQELEESLLK